MKVEVTARTYFFSGSRSDLRTVLPGLIVSAICHVLFFMGVIFAPGLDFHPTVTPSAINVSLVAMPEPVLRPQSKKAAKAVPPHKTKTITKPADVTPKIAPKEIKDFQPKVSMKKKTFKTGKVVENAIKKIEKKVEENRPDPVSEAIKKIKENIKNNPPEESNADDSGHMAAVGGGTGTRSFDKMDLYQLEIRYRVQKNWAFSEQMAGGAKDLQTILVIKIMSNGEIMDVWFEKKSGQPASGRICP